MHMVPVIVLMKQFQWHSKHDLLDERGEDDRRCNTQDLMKNTARRDIPRDTSSWRQYGVTETVWLSRRQSGVTGTV